MPNAHLLALADALEEEAAAADYLGGLAVGTGDEDKVQSCREDAATMRRWAELNRTISASQE